MDRRTFLKFSAVGLAGVAGPRIALARKPKGEFIDIPKWGQKYAGHRLYLNGRDITNETITCHTGQGWAQCYVPDLGGKPLRQWKVDKLNSRLTDLRYGTLEIRKR